MTNKKNLQKLSTKYFVFFITLMFLFSTYFPFYGYNFSSVTPVSAATDSCSTSSPSTNSYSSPRVGGVALDQAATFLANMDDVVGAYYDDTLDRIVFVGKTNTSLPEFDKDDLATAIRAVLFNKEMPAVSIEWSEDPGMMDVIYFGGIEDTRFGSILFEADYNLKQYVNGYDEDDNHITSSVSGYKSVVERYLDKTPQSGLTNSGRQWIEPDDVILKKDDSTDSFVFDTVTMKVDFEPLSVENDPKYDEAAEEFATHHTQYFDDFANEIPAYKDTKQLAKIVGVIKWLSDNGIATDFSWAHDYTPTYVSTPDQIVELNTYVPNYNGYSYTARGGVQYRNSNDYITDDGSAAGLKTASEAVGAPKEDMHWTFTENSIEYDAVAVAADAFRSLGSYNTSQTDMSFPTAGDLSLSFTRSYSSYSGGQFGIGRGWSILPAQLVDNRPIYNGEWMITYQGDPTTRYRAFLAFTLNGQRETFSPDLETPYEYVPDDSVFHSDISVTHPVAYTGRYKVTTKNQISYIFEEYQNDSQVMITDYSLRLVAVEDKGGSKINYSYESSTSPKLTNISDDNGHTITINYNGDLISSVEDWTDRTVSYTYDTQGNLLTVTDPNGGVTTYTYDSNNKLATITDRNSQLVLTNTYTEEAKIATQEDAAGNTRTRTYDHTNQEITITDGQTVARTEVASYDDKGRILEIEDALSNTVTYTYGTEYAPLTIVDKNNNTTTYTYDSNGNMTSVTFPNTTEINYEYDSSNRLTEITDERYSTPKVTTFTYDGSGNVTEKDEAGLDTTFTYNGAGEMLTRTDPLSHVVTWTRDTFGNMLTEVNATNKTTTYTYNSLARLTELTDANSKEFSYTYDDNGNLLTETNYFGTTTYQYDDENRLTKTIYPDSTEKDYTYNTSGSLATVIDQMDYTTSYGYDAYQNLTSKEDALDKTTSYLYDKLNRQTQVTSHLGKVYAWEYDGNGNITKRIDAKNNETLYTYDSLNRLTEIEYPDLSTVTFTYDNRGNMTQMIDPNGTSTYTYDAFDRLLTSADSNGNEVGYEYDNAGNIVTLIYPDDKEVAYTYDANNRLASVSDWNNNTTSYTYNDNGTLATKTYPNTTSATYSYDEANRLSGIVHKQSTTTKATFAYTRNNLGFITSESYSGTWIGTGRTNGYTYDALGRLLTATYSYDDDFTYTYDAVGNLLTKKINTGTPIQYSYNNDHVLTGVDYPGGTTYDITVVTDDNGNMTKKDGVSGSYDDVNYTYDYENRLTEINDGTFNEEYYKYDGKGNRIETDNGSYVDDQINDISGKLPRLIAVSENGYIMNFIVHGLTPISYGSSLTSGRGYMYEDAIGNTKYRKSNTGSGSYGGLMEYEPYGKWAYGSGLLPPYHFHSQLLSQNAEELYYMNARYYDAELNRFISRDPVSGSLTNPQTQNPYAYSLNNPINFSDPSGEFAVAIPLAGACIAGVVAYGVATLPAVQTAVGNIVSGVVNTVSTLFANDTKAGNITGYTKHGEEQAQGRDGGKGVAQGAIESAVSNPREVINQGGGTIKYVGENATVILNGAGQVITTWANNSSGVRNP